jgi:hypothetical protein
MPFFSSESCREFMPLSISITDSTGFAVDISGPPCAG